MSKDDLKTLLQRKCAPLEDKPIELFYLVSKAKNGDHFFSTNTYFNRFAASHWAQIPKLDKVKVNFRSHFIGSVEVKAESAEGEFLIQQLQVEKGFDYSIQFSASGVKSVWLECTSKDEITYKDIDFEFHTKNTSYLEQRSSIVICTFNKAQLLDRNLKQIHLNFDEKLVDQIFVINQGDDQINIPPHPAFKVITQENFGGSGGFARGIYEYLKSDSTGVILMDDDIVFIPEVIYRMLRFASLGENNFAISTQMLNLHKPKQVWSDQELIDLRKLWSAPHGRHLFDANNLPELFPEGDMVAWWCGYFPRNFVNQVGLPLPMFIHWDDIEYSLRLKVIPNFKVLTVYGFGVWHEPFDSKSTWGWVSYFDIRNALIGSSIHGGKFIDCYRKVFAVLIVSAISNRYQANAAIRIGIRDFLNGPQCMKIDQRTRAVRAFSSIDLKSAVTPSDHFNDLKSIKLHRPWKAMILILLKIFYRITSRHKTHFTSHSYAPARALAFSNQTIILSPYGGVLENLVRDRALLLNSLLESIKIIVKFPFFWKRAKNVWVNDFAVLASVKSWSEIWDAQY